MRLTKASCLGTELILDKALSLKSPGFRLAGWQPTVITPRPQLRMGGTGDKHKSAKTFRGIPGFDS